MRSKDVLKNALRQFDGTIIVVSHDREFLDELIDKIYEFSDGRVREHIGGIYDFLRKRKMESLKELEQKQEVKQAAKPIASPEATTKDTDRQKLSYEERKEQDRHIRKAENAVASVEQQITDLDKVIADMEQTLADPSAHGIDLSDGSYFKKYEEAKRQVAELINKWEKLQHDLEKIRMRKK